MSTNLPKPKRDDLLSKISAIRAYIACCALGREHWQSSDLPLRFGEGCERQEVWLGFWGTSGSHWIKFSQSSSEKSSIRLCSFDMWSYFCGENGLYAQAFSLLAARMESCF